MSDRYAALLLDMDGTIVDSEPVHIRAHHVLCQRRGLAVRDDEIAGNIGKGDREFYERIARRHGLPVDVGPWLDEKEAILLDLYRQEGLPLRPGVVALLDHARDIGLCCCVVTNSHRESARAALTAAGVIQRLPIRVCFEDVARHKPDPEPYVRAASRLGVPVERCLAIEDSEAGVRSAGDAGATVVGFAGLVSRGRLLGVGASRVVDDLGELLPLASVPQAPGLRPPCAATGR